MINLPDKIKENKSKGIKRYPCKSNRASALGYSVPELGGCIRRGVYERTSWQEKALWEVEQIMRLNEGNHQEKIVMMDLAEAGIQVIEQQTPYEWAKFEITGSIDGKIVVDGKAIPLEIKSMSPNIFRTINDLSDFRRYSWTTSYLAQIQIYMLLQNADQAVFLLKDKSSGALKQINVALDLELAEKCLKAAERINEHIRDQTYPERIEDREKCKDCPFKLTCLPDIQWGEELKIEDDPELESRIDEYLELEDSKKRAAELWKVITSRAKSTANSGNLNILVGKYRVTGKTDSKGSFRTKIEH